MMLVLLLLGHVLGTFTVTVSAADNVKALNTDQLKEQTITSCVPEWVPPPQNYFALKPKDKLPANLETVVNYAIPLGFSRSGKFAYLSAADAEGCESDEGCGSFRLKIVDLKSDKTLKDEELHHSRGHLDGQLLRPEDVACPTWGRVKKTLTENGIETNFSVGKGDYRYKFGAEKNKSNPIEVPVIFSTPSGEKRIGVLEHPRGVYSPEGLGFVQSPFESRAAVFVGFRSRGWERTEFTQTDVVVFGASLNSGFK